MVDKYTNMKAITQSKISKVQTITDSPTIVTYYHNRWTALILVYGSTLTQLSGELIESPVDEYPIYWFEELTFLHITTNK